MRSDICEQPDTGAQKAIGRLARLLALAGGVAVMSAGLPAGLASAAASTLYVDKANPACTNSGQGTEASPFCSIGAAAARAVAGQTVKVAAATYSERVVPKYSGTSQAPVIYAADPGVVVRGGTNGFKLSSRSWITVRGFTITGTTGVGIIAKYASNLLIEGNDVSYAGQRVSGLTAKGISVIGNTGTRLVKNITHDNSDAGIYVAGASTGIRVTSNRSFSNARGYTRAAAGIDMRGSSGNVVDGNYSYLNEDSGINIWSSSQNGLVYNNVAYRNGDHGIDLHSVTDARVVSNTVYQNVDSGIEATGSLRSSLTNNICADNGINSPRTAGNIRTDTFSAPSTVVNYDLLSLSTPGVMVDWAGKKYATLSTFSTATGQEARGIEASPMFNDAANGDFHLAASSAAIDSANSDASGQPTVDADGQARVDAPTVADTGAGIRSYDDRGAFEYQP